MGGQGAGGWGPGGSGRAAGQVTQPSGGEVARHGAGQPLDQAPRHSTLLARQASEAPARSARHPACRWQTSGRPSPQRWCGGRAWGWCPAPPAGARQRGKVQGSGCMAGLQQLQPGSFNPAAPGHACAASDLHLQPPHTCVKCIVSYKSSSNAAFTATLSPVWQVARQRECREPGQALGCVARAQSMRVAPQAATAAPVAVGGGLWPAPGAAPRCSRPRYPTPNSWQPGEGLHAAGSPRQACMAGDYLVAR